MKTAEAKPATAQAQKITQPFFNKAGGALLSKKTSEGQAAFFSSRQNNFFNDATIQKKLTVGQPNDKYEQEADAMADKVVQRLRKNEKTPSAFETVVPLKTVQAKPLVPIANITPLIQTKCASCEQEEKLQKKDEEQEPGLLHGKLQEKPIFESNVKPPDEDNRFQRKCADCEKEQKLQKKENNLDAGFARPTLQLKPIFESNAAPEERLQRKCASCEQEEHLQKQENNGGAQSATPSVESSLSASKGGGSPLPESTRAQMESYIGADFSGVRIHNNSAAAELSNNLNAQAFTHGNDIYFNSGKYEIGSNEGKHLLAHELTHTVQQNGGLVNSIQPRLFDDRTERQKVDDALASKDSGDVKDIEDVYAATEPERIKLLNILIDQWWAGNSDESMMEKIWDSFGDKMFNIASANIALWKKCFDKGADLDELPRVKGIKAKFGQDVQALAKQYMDLNRSYTEEELQSLGLNNPEKTSEEDKSRVMNELKLAAEFVKKAQDGQVRLKQMRIVGADILPCYGEFCMMQTLPATFNPEKPPDFQDRGKDEQELPTWAEAKKQYDRLTGTIIGLSNQYPSIYALVRDEKVGEFYNADTAQAKAIVNQSLNNVLKYIAITIEKIDNGDISFYDLVPIHQQLFDGSKKGQSQVNWNEESYKWVAENDVSAHESKEFWITIGLTTLAAAAFVVAELATAGTATFAIAAGIGIGIGAGQAINSWDHYMSLTDASKSNVNDETALVSQGQASAALFEAILNTAFVFIDLYAPVAKGIRAATKVGEEAVEAGSKVAGKEALEKAEKDLAEKAAGEMAQKSAEKKAAEQLAKEAGESGGKGLSKTVLESLKEIFNGFTESVKKWGKWVFEKLGFKSYEVVDEGEFLVLYGIRSRIQLARFRKASLEQFLVEMDDNLADILTKRATKLSKSRAAMAAGNDLLGYALRKDGILMSEKLGEEVAQILVEKKFPGAVLMHIGEGSGTLDLIYQLPSGEFLVIEAKGAGGRLGTRMVAGVEVQQGSKTYLKDVIKSMIERGSKAGASAEEKAQAREASNLLKSLDKNQVRFGLVKAPIPKPGETFIDAAYREFLIM